MQFGWVAGGIWDSWVSQGYLSPTPHGCCCSRGTPRVSAPTNSSTSAGTPWGWGTAPPPSPGPPSPGCCGVSPPDPKPPLFTPKWPLVPRSMFDHKSPSFTPEFLFDLIRGNRLYNSQRFIKHQSGARVQGDFSIKLSHQQHILPKTCRVRIYISIGLHNTNIHMHR